MSTQSLRNRLEDLAEALHTAGLESLPRKLLDAATANSGGEVQERALIALVDISMILLEDLMLRSHPEDRKDYDI